MKIRKKNTSYLRRFEKEIAEAAEKNGLTDIQAEDLLDDYFKSLKKYITDDTLPKILIPNFGVFKPSLKKINNRLRHWIQRKRNGSIGDEVFHERFGHLWLIRQRLIKEQNNEQTHRCWNKNKTIEKIKENCFECEKKQ